MVENGSCFCRSNICAQFKEPPLSYLNVASDIRKEIGPDAIDHNKKHRRWKMQWGKLIIVQRKMGFISEMTWKINKS